MRIARPVIWWAPVSRLMIGTFTVCRGSQVSAQALTQESGCRQAFHGTRWYAVWSILSSKVLLESNNHALGHDFWESGVYCTPEITTARSYGIPHELFGDGVYYRAMFEVIVDPNRRKKRRAKGGEQWVFPSEAVRLKALWVQPNSPPATSEWRFITWEEELEARPVVQPPPCPVRNTWKWNLLTQRGSFFSRPPPRV